MLAVDTVEASVTGPDGIRRTVVLDRRPLHPLRLLWLVTWAELGQHWLESCRGRVTGDHGGRRADSRAS